MIELPKGASRDIRDINLTRYACYLIVQNADPRKEVVALGQTYFAVQTRRQELKQVEFNNIESENDKRLFLRNEMIAHNKKLADAARDAGVITPLDYAKFQNYGYKGLYNGMDAK
jgi:DNA-damage-inducible protein D